MANRSFLSNYALIFAQFTVWCRVQDTKWYNVMNPLIKLDFKTWFFVILMALNPSLNLGYICGY